MGGLALRLGWVRGLIDTIRTSLGWGGVSAAARTALGQPLGKLHIWDVTTYLGKLPLVKIGLTMVDYSPCKIYLINYSFNKLF